MMWSRKHKPAPAHPTMPYLTLPTGDRLDLVATKEPDGHWRIELPSGPVGSYELRWDSPPEGLIELVLPPNQRIDGFEAAGINENGSHPLRSWFTRNGRME